MTKIPTLNNHSISEIGVVINTKTGKAKTQRVAKNGYYTVNIIENNKATVMYVHRLLALTFIPNPENKRTVNHIDGNKLNNSLSNLEWSTDKENIKHAYDNNLNKGCSKVTEEHLKEIYERFFNGETLTSISKDLPYNNVTVSNHFTKYINSIGEQEKRLTQETKNKLVRAKLAGESKRDLCVLQMINPITNIIEKTFSSLAEARKFLNKNSSGPISNVLSGKQKIAYGYFWKKFYP